MPDEETKKKVTRVKGELHQNQRSKMGTVFVSM